MSARTAVGGRDLPPHAHRPAVGEPADWDGRQVCADCGLIGKAGDPRHPADAPSLAVARLQVSDDVRRANDVVRRRFERGDPDE